MAVDLWARFLANEKLAPQRMDEWWAMELVRLCEAMARVRGPRVRPHRAKLESRRFVAETAMDLGIDLPAIRHKVTGRLLIGRGLLDAWNVVYTRRYGSTLGTACAREAKRRDIKTRLHRTWP